CAEVGAARTHPGPIDLNRPIGHIATHIYCGRAVSDRSPLNHPTCRSLDEAGVQTALRRPVGETAVAGYVSGPLDEALVAARGKDDGPDRRGLKVLVGHERPGGRTNPVIEVRPAHSEAPVFAPGHIRGQGGPPDEAVAVTPGHPRRCPRVAGHPVPVTVVAPASIVVGGPAPRVVRDVGPAEVRVG